MDLLKQYSKKEPSCSLKLYAQSLLGKDAWLKSPNSSHTSQVASNPSVLVFTKEH